MSALPVVTSVDEFTTLVEISVPSAAFSEMQLTENSSDLTTRKRAEQLHNSFGDGSLTCDLGVLSIGQCRVFVKAVYSVNHERNIIRIDYGITVVLQ